MTGRLCLKTLRAFICLQVMPSDKTLPTPDRQNGVMSVDSDFNQGATMRPLSVQMWLPLF